MYCYNPLTSLIRLNHIPSLSFNAIKALQYNSILSKGKLVMHILCRATITIQIMPQLLPFYFINQLSFSFLVLITMVYVFGTYILPVFAELFVTRMYITKL